MFPLSPNWDYFCGRIHIPEFPEGNRMKLVPDEIISLFYSFSLHKEQILDKLPSPEISVFVLFWGTWPKTLWALPIKRKDSKIQKQPGTDAVWLYWWTTWGLWSQDLHGTENFLASGDIVATMTFQHEASLVLKHVMVHTILWYTFCELYNEHVLNSVITRAQMLLKIKAFKN